MAHGAAPAPMPLPSPPGRAARGCDLDRARERRHARRACDDNAFVEMRDEAARYCSLIERADSFEQEPFAVALAESLAGLVAAAAQLPAVEPTEVDVTDGPPRTEWSRHYAGVQRVLGEWA